MTVIQPSTSAAESRSLTVQHENPLVLPNWDTERSRSTQQSFFHGAAWASVLQETYGFQPLYFTAWENGNLKAILPVMEVSSWLTGRRGVSLPFTDHCIAKYDAEAISSIVTEALREGRKRAWKYLEVRGRTGIPGIANGTSPSLCFYGHRLSLIPGPDEIFGHLEGRARNAIRKAEKSGVVAETSQDLDAVRKYYLLHCKTRKKHGLPPQPYRFFASIHRHILSKNLGTVVSARYKNQTIASAIYFHEGHESIYKFGASDVAFQELRANNLVMWEAIKWCAHKGSKSMDFGRTSMTNEGLRRYKLSWGTQEFPIHYYRYAFGSDRIVLMKDEAFGWHNRIFGALPLPVSRLIGAILYRHTA